jgi:hypothetical protein
MVWLAAARVAVVLALAAPSPAAAPPAAPLAAPASSAPRAAGPAVPAASVLAQLQRETPVDLVGATVDGTLNLSAVGTVRVPFRCRNCVFDQDVIARDVVFQREVDLSGAAVKGALDVAGAQFGQAALFGQGTSASHFDGPADFSVATFSDRVSFNDATFGDRADFTAARFSAPADFTGTSFTGAASFADTVFSDRLNCLVCEFLGPLTLARAELIKAASFVGATYNAPATFDFLSASDTIDFSNDHFLGDVSFFGLNGSGQVNFLQAQFTHKVVFNSFASSHLRFDTATVRKIDGEEHQRQVLQMIEDDAKSRNDLTVANQAHFLHLELSSHHQRGVARLWDVVVYRWVFGYLVRPLYPLLWLVGLVVVVSAWRAVVRPRPGGVGPARKRARPAAIERVLTRFLDEIGQTIGWVVSLKLQASDSGERTLALWSEFLVAKALLAGVVLGVANSNTTLRQLLDAVK